MIRRRFVASVFVISSESGSAFHFVSNPIRSIITPRKGLSVGWHVPKLALLKSTSTARTISMALSSSSTNHPPLIDVDCNLWHVDLKPLREDNNITDSDDKEFASFRLLPEDAVLESNIVAVLSPSSTLCESKRGLVRLDAGNDVSLNDISSRLKIRSTVGIHPYHVQDEDIKDQTVPDLIQTMRELLQKYASHCAAVGECGLDASEGFPPLDAQLELFTEQVKLAHELQLPLFVHERLAFTPCLDILQQHSPQNSVPIIIHCFTGTTQECQTYIDKGYFVSLSGYIFKEEAADIRQCLQTGIIPLDRLMIETDAPYMGFAGCRSLYAAKNDEYIQSLNSKKRKRLLNSIYPNVPSSLPIVLGKILEEINVGRTRRGEVLLTREQLALQTSRNADQFFGFDLAL